VTSVADLADLALGIGEACALSLRDFGGRLAFSGPIRTIACFEDNLLARRMLESPGNDAVLVLDGGGSLRRALIGDNLAEIGIANGWAGIVVNGAVRDTAALARMAIGIKALGVNPMRCARDGTGTAEMPVAFGGVVFTPGAWVYCDGDGVLVVPERMAAG